VRPRITIAIAALVVVLAGMRASFGPEERIAFLLYDDAYYYLGVARHLAAGEGSTFDGLHATNGYHPLWCGALVPLVALARDPGHAVRAVGALWFVLAAAVPWATWWALRRRFGDPVAAFAAVIVTLQPWIALALARPNGLETPLYALAILAVVGAADRVLDGSSSPPSTAQVAGLGVLVGTCVLARLDGGCLAVAVAAVMLVVGLRSWGMRPTLTRVAVLTLAATAIAGPSLVWNQARFGSPLPISGRVVALEAERERASLGGVLSASNLLRRARYATADIPASIVRRAALGIPGERLVTACGAWAGLAATAAIAALAWVAWRRRCACPISAGDPALVLAAFAALHYAAYALWLWTPGEDVYRAYYFLPEVLLLAVLLGWGLTRLKPVVGIAAIVVLALHLGVESERYLALLDAQPGRVADRFIYGWIRENLPADAVLGARDAGKLGWFSGRTVVGLDGLINDDRFFAALRGGTEGAYVCDSPIRYVLIDRPYLDGYLTELAKTASCSFRDTDPASRDWAVVEVLRPGVRSADESGN
jgi:hypothetical protein